ncbi:hypothetical protein V9T40_000780 [Parthenolecanium corni]|uniref:Uncharacterized protein n=1 Tax=Parthenolecanium corni TaxID=536013 RepID=A0AAN9Y0Q6_9HEMI
MSQNIGYFTADRNVEPCGQAQTQNFNLPPISNISIDELDWTNSSSSQSNSEPNVENPNVENVVDVEPSPILNESFIEFLRNHAREVLGVEPMSLIDDDGCIYVSKINTEKNYYPYGVIISVFVCWNLFCLLQLTDTTYASFSLISLYAEKFIVGLLETQLCLLLYVIKVAVAQINEDITEEVFRRENDNMQIYDINWRFNKPGVRMSGSLLTEHFRKLHLKIFDTMESLNKSYSLGNLMLTLRERLSFAFYLYFWITRNHLFDLILASVNFLKVGMIFYCFQKLKNEFHIFSKQVHALEIKFDACGLFSMDFDTVFSVRQ